MGPPLHRVHHSRSISHHEPRNHPIPRRPLALTQRPSRGLAGDYLVQLDSQPTAAAQACFHRQGQAVGGRAITRVDDDDDGQWRKQKCHQLASHRGLLQVQICAPHRRHFLLGKVPVPPDVCLGNAHAADPVDAAYHAPCQTLVLERSGLGQGSVVADGEEWQDKRHQGQAGKDCKRRDLDAARETRKGVAKEV